MCYMLFVITWAPAVSGRVKNRQNGAENNASHQLASSGFNECHEAEFYSREPLTVYQPGDERRKFGTTKPLSDIPQYARFLSTDDQWLQGIQTVTPPDVRSKQHVCDRLRAHVTKS
jgi:hypothetical protein